MKELKKIVISGASGFTGRSLSKLLCDNDYEIYAVKRASNSSLVGIVTELKELDIHDAAQVEKVLASGEIVAVIHLATLYHRDEKPLLRPEIWEANFSLGKKLLELALASKSHFIHVESYLQFEDVIKTEYLKSKIAFSQLVDQEREKNRIGITSLVFFDNYGNLDGRNKILDQLIEAKKCGKPISLENSKRVIIFTWIEDVTKALLSCINKNQMGRYRVNSSDKYALGDLAEYIWHFPHSSRPRKIKKRVYRAELYSMLDSFCQTQKVFEYCEMRLAEDSKS